MGKRKGPYVPPTWFAEAKRLKDDDNLTYKEVAARLNVTYEQLRYAFDAGGARTRGDYKQTKISSMTEEERKKFYDERSFSHTVFEPWKKRPRSTPVKIAGQICEATMDAARKFASGEITRDELMSMIGRPAPYEKMYAS